MLLKQSVVSFTLSLSTPSPLIFYFFSLVVGSESGTSPTGGSYSVCLLRVSFSRFLTSCVTRSPGFLPLHEDKVSSGPR